MEIQLQLIKTKEGIQTEDQVPHPDLATLKIAQKTEILLNLMEKTLQEKDSTKQEDTDFIFFFTPLFIPYLTISFYD